MKRGLAVASLLVVAVACAIFGAWEAAAFVAAGGCLTALLGPADNHVS